MNLVTHIIFIYMVRTVFGNVLLYKINDAESIYITNKSTSRLGQPESELIGNGDALVSLLYSGESYVLVGEVDKIYNISRGRHEEIVVKSGLKRLNSECKNAYQCQNYIRAAFPVGEDKHLVTCGTRDLRCRLNDHVIPNLSPDQLIQFKDKARTNSIAPFSFLNSVYFFHSTIHVWDMFKQDYVFNGTDVVFKDLVRLPSGAIRGPNFRTAFGHEDKVYTFFSESEIVHQKEIFFKTFESYVGEVCAEDDGKNANDLLKRFVTFKKTNINCYLPDYTEMAHSKYTEIQQVTRPVEVMNQNTGQMDQVFYAVFSARRSNEIDSAVCMFEMSSVKRSMSGLFKNNQDKSPRKPLNSCADYKKLTPTQIDTYTKNISRHSKFEMDESVNRRAFLALKNTKLTSIAIDSQAKDHIVYIGTENGRLLKVINRPSNVKGHTRPIILSDVPIFANESVVNIIVSDGVITLIGQSQIKKVNIEYFCQSLNTCTNCVLSEDPDCAWTVNGCALTKLGFEQKKCLISHYDFIVADKKSPVPHQTTKFSSIFITFLFTFFPTCILTCLITFYIIKKSYKLIEKNETDGDKRLVDFFKSRNFRPSVAVKKKLLNCYETQPVVCIDSRPESTSNSPFNLTSCSSTSTESNSPNYSNKNNSFTQDKQFKDSSLIRIC